MVASNHYDRLTVKLPVPWHVDVVEIPQLPDGSGRWSAVCTFEAKVGAAEWPCLAVLKSYVLVVNCWVTLVIDTNIHIWSYMIGVYFWFFRLNYYRSFAVLKIRWLPHFFRTSIDQQQWGYTRYTVIKEVHCPCWQRDTYNQCWPLVCLIVRNCKGSIEKIQMKSLFGGGALSVDQPGVVHTRTFRTCVFGDPWPMSKSHLQHQPQQSGLVSNFGSLFRIMVRNVIFSGQIKPSFETNPKMVMNWFAQLLTIIIESRNITGLSG